MMHPIRGGTVLGAAPVARVRRKISVRGQAIEDITPGEPGPTDAANVETSPLTPGEPLGSSRQVAPAVLAALLALHHGG